MSSTQIQTIQNEVDVSFNNAEIAKTLLATTFKGLQAPAARQAMLEGRMRGFTFENFLKKDVYAVPFGQNYSLVTSIDYARKVAMESGSFAGKDAPVYQYDDKGVIISCSMTVYRMVNNVRCPFTSLVFFEEYAGKGGLWGSKPRTMIAKVAEMHALRMSFPETLDKAYSEEEMVQIPKSEVEVVVPPVDVEAAKKKLFGALHLDELKQFWEELSQSEKNNEEVKAYKEELKAKFLANKPNEGN